MLAENGGRWESLSEADRERLELVAATIVKRLLHQPTLRLKARGDDQRTYAYVQALRELFGLDAEQLSAFEATAGEPRRRRSADRRARRGHADPAHARRGQRSR